MIRYIDILHDSVVDGEGLRSVLYTCGCKHRCKGCHNPESWEYKNGRNSSLEKTYNELTKNPLTNITYSGGDPFEQCEFLIKLSKLIKENTSKSIWCYTGFTFEEILKDKDKLELLKYIDVLVDGKFEIENKDLKLLFRGSSNQRIISVGESLKRGVVVLWNSI